MLGGVRRFSATPSRLAHCCAHAAVERATAPRRRRAHLALQRCRRATRVPAGGVAVCGRRMDAHWVHGRSGHRCRHGHHSTRSRPVDGPKPVYWREHDLLERIAAAVVPDQPGTGDIGAEMVSVLRGQGVTVLCGRQESEVRIVPVRSRPPVAVRAGVAGSPGHRCSGGSIRAGVPVGSHRPVRGLRRPRSRRALACRGKVPWADLCGSGGAVGRIRRAVSLGRPVS